MTKFSGLKRAFTLSELLVALGVIGVLTAIVMPIIYSLAPDQNTLMAKRAFYTTETVISDLLNDVQCYPKTLSRVGLDDGLGYNRCRKWGGEENTGALTNENSADKLVTLFSDKLDLKESVTTEGTSKKFKTRDGMVWTFSNFNFSANNPDSYVLLTVDVNGDKDPNCGQSASSGQCVDKNRKNGFDRFAMRIFARGRIEIIDCWAKLAAKVDKKLVGKEDAICDGNGGNSGENQECTTAPSSPDDFCCNDSRWKNSPVCNTCVSAPTSADDYCCTQASGSSWVGTEACDPCTYLTPSPGHECCLPGHKWYGKPVCNVCSNPDSLACCQTKTSAIEYGDPCCNHQEIYNSVSACRNQTVTVSASFRVSAQYPKDNDTWGNTKIASVSSLSDTLPFDVTIKYIRSCPGGVGCGSYGAGMSCVIRAGEKTCSSNEEFVNGNFQSEFNFTKPEPSKADFTGFKPSYTTSGEQQGNYTIKFKFPGTVQMYD